MPLNGLAILYNISVLNVAKCKIFTHIIETTSSFVIDYKINGSLINNRETENWDLEILFDALRFINHINYFQILTLFWGFKYTDTESRSSSICTASLIEFTGRWYTISNWDPDSAMFNAVFRSTSLVIAERPRKNHSCITGVTGAHLIVTVCCQRLK